MKTVVALPGEGIGLEVVDATCELLAGTGLPLKILTPPQGAAAVKSHGVGLPEETKRAAREADGVLFGAAGGPATPAVVTWLRWQMNAWAGVRPIRFYMGLATEAERLESAVGRVYRDGKTLTPDQGGTATTREMAQAVLAAYRNA